MEKEVWLPLEDIAVLTDEINETVRRKCKRNEYVSKVSKNGRFKDYQILLSSLPENFQNKYLNQKQEQLNQETKKYEKSIEEYSKAPLWARKQADKYMEILPKIKGLSHGEIIEFLKIWNEKYPDKASSYSCLFNAKKNFEKYGISGLLSKRGNCGKKNNIDEQYYEYYKSLYLREGQPSANSCWRVTLGYALGIDSNLDISKFPSCKSFDRLLKKRVPKQAIYLARHGEGYWNKKYASYIPRSYENITAGEVWVSDHAQIDIAVKYNGKVSFPWVTVFRDVKTSKWLGWFLHADSPNSDHIFQAFYYGVEKFGLPKDVYLDNGKDYRCNDFAGGRNAVKIKHSNNESALLSGVGVNVHFALPYNAQTKPVERDFLKIKTYLSKLMTGYRGGNVTERPEKLKTEIKNDKIMEFDDFKKLFDGFIVDTLNKIKSKGKVLQGKCPDELWAEEFTTKRVMTKDALKLFCMRSTKSVTIGRNGVYDSRFQVTYWGDWMACYKGTKVFIRRDINAYQEAWVFDSKTEQYLGKAQIHTNAPFLAKTDIEKVQLKKALEMKKQEKKMLKSAISSKFYPTNDNIIENLRNLSANEEYLSNPKISKIANTKMDKVVQEEKQLKKQSSIITSYANYSYPKRRRIFLTEAEKRRALQEEQREQFG